jgi:hypothetical protein
MLIIAEGRGTGNNVSIVDHIKKQKAKTGEFAIDQVTCADGFQVSCQASKFHYCIPREDNADWTHIELGYPSAKPTIKIRTFAEDKSDLLGTVYGYVPVKLVDEMLVKHGGIKA